jgi:zinc protease
MTLTATEGAGRRCVLPAVAGAVALLACAGTRPRPAPQPPAAPVTAPAPDLSALERWRLTSGLEVLMLPRAGTGLVRVRAIVRAGRHEAGAGRPGLAAFTAALLRAGAAGRSAADIDERVAAAGGLLEVTGEPSCTVVSCRVLAAHLPVCLQVVADLLRRPNLARSEVAAARDELLAAVSESVGDGAQLARAHFESMLFGEHHPDGRMLRAPDVQRLTNAEARRFWRASYRPDSTWLAVSGEIDRDGVRAGVARYFGGWAARAGAAPPVFGAPPRGPLRVRLVDQPRSAQASVVLGHLGPGPRHRDWYAAVLVNHVLGGSELSSRLMMELRARRGLTYSVRSSLEAGAGGSTFRVVLATAPENVGAVLAGALAELRAMRSSGPTTDELARARGFIAGGHPLRAERVDDLVEAVLGARLAGLDDAFVRELPGRLLAVDTPAAARAARTFLDPDRVTVAIVGDARRIAPQLRLARLPFETVAAGD